jgi:hypothetical protein
MSLSKEIMLLKLQSGGAAVFNRIYISKKGSYKLPLPVSLHLTAAIGFPAFFCGWKPQDPIAAL